MKTDEYFREQEEENEFRLWVPFPVWFITFYRRLLSWKYNGCLVPWTDRSKSILSRQLETKLPFFSIFSIFLLLLYVYAYMCACMCIHSHVNVCTSVCLHTCMWRPEVNARDLTVLLFTLLFWNRMISLTLIHMDSIGWLASGLQRSFCLHPPELGLKMCAQFLTGVLRHLNSGPHACVSRTVLTKLLPLQPFSTHCNSLQKSKASKQILCLTLLLVIYTSSVKRLNKNLLELKSLFIALCGFVDPISL